MDMKPRVAALLALLAAVPSSPDAGEARERYRYALAARGGTVAAIDVSIGAEDGGLAYESSMISADGTERILVHTGLDGDLIDASRTVSDPAGVVTRRQTAWRAEDAVVIRRAGAATVKDIDIPPGAQPVVDASLLLLLRSFPFGTATIWHLLVVDFSHVSVAATVRQVGLERILVPAGEFECYRMEVVVSLPVVRPRVTFWIAAADPHFLVRHEGKKGPFTPFYETSLLSVEPRR
jgi:hypothetical protein